MVGGTRGEDGLFPASDRFASGVFRADACELSLPQKEPLAAPGDGVAGEAPGPEEERDEIAGEEQKKIAQHLHIAEDTDADHERERHAHQQSEDEERDAFEAEAAGDEVEEG